MRSQNSINRLEAFKANRFAITSGAAATVAALACCTRDSVGAGASAWVTCCEPARPCRRCPDRPAEKSLRRPESPVSDLRLVG